MNDWTWQQSAQVPESFWGACCAIWKVLSTNYGHARIHFAAPFSLREYVQNNHRLLAAAGSNGNASSSNGSSQGSGSQEDLCTVSCEGKLPSMLTPPLTTSPAIPRATRGMQKRVV